MADDSDKEPTYMATLMAERDITADWLAGRSRMLFPRMPVSKSTISNWRRGTSKVAQDWRSVAVIAQLLDLPLAMADELFESLGCLTVSQRMRVDSSEQDAELLTRWRSEMLESSVAQSTPVPTSDRSSVEDACRLILLEAHEAERDAQSDVAAKLYDRAFEMSRDAGLTDLAVQAAVGGAGLSGTVGGQPARLRRLQVLFAEVSGGPEPLARFGELVVELAYEVWVGQLSWEPRLDHALAEIAEGNGEASVLARRMLLTLNDHTAGSTTASASAIVTDAARYSPSVQVKCLVAACPVAVGHGEWTLASQWISQLDDLGRRFGEPRALWQSAVNRAALLDARGLREEADAEAQRALELGRRFGHDDAEITYGLLSVGRAFREDRLGSFAPVFEHISSRYEYPVAFGLRGLTLVDSNPELAKEQLGHARQPRPKRIDPFHACSLAVAVLLASRLDDAATAKEAATELASWAGRLLFLGTGGPFFAPVDWFLALAADLAGDHDARDRLVASADNAARLAGADSWMRAPIRSTLTT